jgi:formate hydrogenlyase subunit 6/NADH:ubiquinone oxidoreductase subunit I
MPALKGVGLLKGLGVTLKTMTRPAATRQYPHVKPDLPARTRGVIALIEENCTVCMLCSRECPDWCIYIDSHKEVVASKEGGRARTRNILDRFAIDYALCMYCGICVEVCPFDALHWSPEFEYAEFEIGKLTHEMDTLRTWAYTVPAPDPLEEGAVEPKEVETARKAREAAAAKAATAAEQARTAAPAAAAPAAPTATAPAPAGAPPAPVDGAARPTPDSATLPHRGAEPGAGPVEAAPAAAAAPAAPAAPRPADVEVEPGIDQATYERLLAAGEPDRTARAKAKAAYMRKAKAEARAAQAAGAAPSEAAAPAPAAEAPAAEPASVETPAAAVSAPETAPPAPSATGTPEAAEPAADARDPEVRSPEAGETISGTAVDVAPGAAVAQADAEHLEVEVDQETYDRLIAAGEPERTARAKAKAAYARKLRAAQRGGGGSGTGAGS